MFTPLEANPEYFIPSTSTTPLTITLPSIHDYDCDFERNCLWKNTGKTLNWTVIRASDANKLYNGPDIDHSTQSGDGSYLAILDKPASGASIAYYSSPNMNGTKCLEFFYYIYGSEVLL